MAGVGVYSPPARDHRLDAVGGQHLERAVEGGLRQRVRVDAEEQRAVDALPCGGRWQIAWVIASMCAFVEGAVE